MIEMSETLQWALVRVRNPWMAMVPEPRPATLRKARRLWREWLNMSGHEHDCPALDRYAHLLGDYGLCRCRETV